MNCVRKLNMKVRDISIVISLFITCIISTLLSCFHQIDAGCRFAITIDTFTISCLVIGIVEKSKKGER